MSFVFLFGSQFCLDISYVFVVIVFSLLLKICDFVQDFLYFEDFFNIFIFFLFVDFLLDIVDMFDFLLVDSFNQVFIIWDENFVFFIYDKLFQFSRLFVGFEDFLFFYSILFFVSYQEQSVQSQLEEEDEVEEEEVEELGYMEIYVDYVLFKFKIGKQYLDCVVEISMLFSVLFLDIIYILVLFLDSGVLFVLQLEVIIYVCQ